jgi:hypothetical protein
MQLGTVVMCQPSRGARAEDLDRAEFCDPRQEPRAVGLAAEDIPEMTGESADALECHDQGLVGLTRRDGFGLFFFV